MQDFAQAAAFVAALTQADPASAIIDVRMIHDVRKDISAIKRRGTLPELWNEIVAWNNQGYGAFININPMDGSGTHEIGNVAGIRCQAVDLDNLSATQNYECAITFNPPPSFAVQSSPGKFHVYWITNQHNNKDGFTLLQRKLRTLFDGDKTCIDPSRVLRLPGLFHLKNPAQPHLVTVWALPGFGRITDPAYLELALHNVNVIDGSGERHDLGDRALQAPGLDWAVKALADCDPNQLDRGEWISITSAFKQAAWNWATEQQILDIWLKWCERYTVNNVAENLKNWNSIRNTQVGWMYLERRNPGLHAMRLFGGKGAELQHQQPAPQPLSAAVPTPQPPAPIPMPSGEFLTDGEQQTYFKDCVLITRSGEILITSEGRFMNPSKFNAKFGGKYFIVDSIGKKTNEAWAAATRSTLWRVPQVDHIRFLPDRETGAIITDELGRKGVNTYKPVEVDSRPGDVAPFLRLLELLLPMEVDRQIILRYIAHNVKFPGFKIPWAPVIQSTEGAGKGILRDFIVAAIGGPYVYSPKAQELVDSGSKFNAWMRSRLFIIVDEIRVDERRDMIEILKPMISEKKIEIQAKGIDQEIEDNPSNWTFFTNYKNAIPISQNSRRFAIFYSAIQSYADLLSRGMDDRYFIGLTQWMANGGTAYVTHWLKNYPIERGDIPMRAPQTTSNNEAVWQSRGPVETIILDAIQDALPGFRGGWISSLAVAHRLKAAGARPVSMRTLTEILTAAGYHTIGRAPRPFFIESKEQRADLFHFDRTANIAAYGDAQGYAI